MADSFDPYHKWLGIPAEDQPPNHYRLLGIEPFESDPDVIATAADGRMAQVKQFQAGRHSEHSQRILNEIAAARVCLLSPEKRADYDRQLRQRLATERPGPAKAAAPAVRKPKPTSADAPATPAVRIQVESAAMMQAVHRSGGRRRWPIVAAAGGGLLLVAAVVAILILTAGRQDGTSGVPVAEVHPKPPAGQEPQPVEPKPVPPEKPKPPEPNPPGPVVIVEPKPRDIDPPVIEEPEPGKKPPEPSPVKPPPEPQESRSAVPDRAELEAKQKEIRVLLHKEMSAAATTDKKLELAQKYRGQALEMRGDAAARYVLFCFAYELASSGGDIDAAFEIIDRIGEHFQADVLGAKADVLTRAVEGMKLIPQAAAANREIAELAKELADAAAAEDDFDTASRFLKLAVAAARKNKDLPLVNELTRTYQRELDRMKARFVTVRKALDTLADDPGNREANLAAGQWYCFAKGNWEKGFPLLAKGSDANLAELAARDLAGPKSPQEQASLADQWWELAEKDQAGSKAVIQSRAGYWYEQAQPKLSGVDKLRVEKRLEAIAARTDTASLAMRRGMIVKGNVALAANGTKVASKGDRGKAGEAMLDGKIQPNPVIYQYGYGDCPCEWVFTFQRTYQLQEIRIYFSTQPPGVFYRYVVEVSPDGERFVTLEDRSEGQWSGLQQIKFAPRAVRAIKLIGRYGSYNNGFRVVEFEAYCSPPKPGAR